MCKTLACSDIFKGNSVSLYGTSTLSSHLSLREINSIIWIYDQKARSQYIVPTVVLDVHLKHLKTRVVNLRTITSWSNNTSHFFFCLNNEKQWEDNSVCIVKTDVLLVQLCWCRLIPKNFTVHFFRILGWTSRFGNQQQCGYFCFKAFENISRVHDEEK